MATRGQVEGSSVLFKLDIGADVSVLPLKLAKTLNFVLKQSDCFAVTFTGHRIPLKSTTARCTMRESCLVIKFVVVDLDKPPLLGLSDCVQLGLIGRVNTLSYEDVLVDHTYIFSGLGMFPFQHYIRVSEDFQPFAESVRRVPYALHERLMKKLAEMEEVVNPVEIVENKNGDL